MNDYKLSSLQDLSGVTSTASNSTNVIDLEESGVTDESMGPLWLTFVVGDTVAVTGLTEGLYIELLTSDSATLASGNLSVVSSGLITVAQLVKGFRQSWGFCMAKMHRYLRAQYRAHTTSAGGTFTADLFISDRPITLLTSQKETT